MKCVPILALLMFTNAAHAAEPAFPTFKMQEIDKTLKVGYGLRIVDLNADGKLDIVVADAARVIWFDQGQDWKLRTIIENAKAGVKADNVCLDIADIDGDGKLDIALGADWQPNNTKDGGSLQWLRQGKTIDEWTVHPIAASIPTLHRIYFANFGTDRPELIVTPLKAKTEGALAVLEYTVPRDPVNEKWGGLFGPPDVMTAELNYLHNVRVLAPAQRAVLTASREGIGRIVPSGGSARWKWEPLNAGHQPAGKGDQGSSEVKPGKLSKSLDFIASIEPLHGHEVVFYLPPASGEGVWKRTVIDDQLKAGHALWCADLNNDGVYEIVAGFRESTSAGVGPGINLYKASGASEPVTWSKHVVDDKGIACEDLACADLNADGRIDIVACGRATGNVRIYWNMGVEKN